MCLVGPLPHGIGLPHMGAAAGTGDYGHGPMGGADLHVPDVFRVVYDTELRGKRNTPLRNILWEIVADWPKTRQLDFLHFVTGSRVVPAVGAEALRVELPHVPLGTTEQVSMLTMLPTSHTCTNTLELPSMWTALQALDATRQAASRGDISAAQQWRGIVQNLPAFLRDLPWAQGQAGELEDVLRELLQRSLLTAVTAGRDGYGLDSKAGGGGVGGGTMTGSSATASSPAGAGSMRTQSPGEVSSDDDDEILAAARVGGGKSSTVGGAVPASPLRGAAAPQEGSHAGEGEPVITLQW